MLNKGMAGPVMQHEFYQHLKHTGHRSPFRTPTHLQASRSIDLRNNSSSHAGQSRPTADTAARRSSSIRRCRAVRGLYLKGRLSNDGAGLFQKHPSLLLDAVYSHLAERPDLLRNDSPARIVKLLLRYGANPHSMHQAHTAAPITR